MKKILAIAIIATFLASTIPLAVSGNNQGLASATYTIEVGDYYAKPGNTPGGGKAPAGYILTGYHWNTLQLTLIINPEYSGLPESDVLAAITASAEEWDSHTTTELVSKYKVSYKAAVNDESAAPDLLNELVFANLGDPKIIAQCTYWWYVGYNYIAEFDIVFNTHFTWGNAEGNPTVMDLQNIATHELGHGFGLGDLYQRKWSEQTMYGYASEGQTNKRDLESGDITGIQTLYGP